VFSLLTEKDECFASVEGLAVSKLVERNLPSVLQLTQRMNLGIKLFNYRVIYLASRSW